MIKIFGLLLLVGAVVGVKESEILTLWRDFPWKIMMNATSVQPLCQKAYHEIMRQLDNNELNALKMLDATAKLSSGILTGNVNQYGDFDQCMEVKTAQYCLVEIDLESFKNEAYLRYKDLIHSFYLFRDKFDDPAHRLPGFSLIRWGFCLPQQCSGDDLQNSLREHFGIVTQIRPGMCQKSSGNPQELTYGDYIARLFFTLIILAIITSTWIDYFCNNLNTSQNLILRILMCFSLRANLSKLFEIKELGKDEIAGLDGIRFLSALALLMSHKAVSLFFNPYMNRTRTLEKFSGPWTIIVKNAIIYTDSFILLSGLVNGYSLLKNLHNGQSIRFKDKLINRLFRILPNVIALILFCTYILPALGSGPLWPTIIDHHSVLCKQYMWRNIFFIHNYFGFENMCLTHTHQLGIDMQLFLITPALVYLVWKSKLIGLSLLVVLALLSSLLRFWVSYQNELTSIVYVGISISKMFEIANLSYIFPTHRATIYLIGVFFAYLLKNSSPKTPFSKVQLTLMWCILLPCFLGTWMGPYHMARPTYVYNKLEASLIAAIYPILWGISISFGIYVTNKKIGGWLGHFLSWKYFQFSTKIAYALYLVQFPVYFYNVGVTKHVDEYKSHYQLQILETACIIMCSVLLVVLIEMPFQNIKRVIFDNKKTTPVIKTKKIATKLKSG